MNTHVCTALSVEPIILLLSSEAFVEVDMLHSVSILRPDGVSQLRLQLGHGHGAVTHAARRECADGRKR